MHRVLSSLVLALVLALAATPVWAQEGQWNTVKEWSGNGIKHTESFTIAEREWRIEWTASNEVLPGAGILQVMVHRADDDQLVTLAANKQGAGRDVSYVRAAPGRFYLTINSGNVDWRVRVQTRR